jgi:sugar phosphate isomerase/epimerase
VELAIFSSATPGWDVHRVVAAAGTLGLGSVEWGAGPGQALGGRDDASRAAELCLEHGVGIRGLSVQDHDATLGPPARAAAYVAMAAGLGALQVRFFPPAYGGGLARAQRRARAAVDRLVGLAAPDGLRVLVENAPGTIAPTPQLALALVEHHGPERVGVLYDPGNALMEGCVQPRLALEQLGPYLAHVHLKNVLWRRRAGVWELGYASLAGGILDVPGVVAALRTSRYRGLVAIDHLHGRPTLAGLRAEVEHLQGMLAA